MQRYIYILTVLAIFTTRAADAAPPPTRQESWACTIDVTIQEMADVQQTIYRRPDTFNYTPAKEVTVEYQTVRLSIHSATPNRDSRLPADVCPAVGENWTSPIPLCEQADIQLGMQTSGRIERWYGAPDYAYCLRLN